MRNVFFEKIGKRGAVIASLVFTVSAGIYAMWSNTDWIYITTLVCCMLLMFTVCYEYYKDAKIAIDSKNRAKEKQQKAEEQLANNSSICVEEIADALGQFSLKNIIKQLKIATRLSKIPKDMFSNLQLHDNHGSITIVARTVKPMEFLKQGDPVLIYHYSESGFKRLVANGIVHQTPDNEKGTIFINLTEIQKDFRTSFEETIRTDPRMPEGYCIEINEKYSDMNDMNLEDAINVLQKLLEER